MLHADWPAHPGIRTASTQRDDFGVSLGVYARANLGSHVGDAVEAVAQNRRLLIEHLGLPQPPLWLDQVHGTTVVDADLIAPDAPPPRADAAVSRNGRVLAILTADCLPVLLCSRDGAVIGAAHAGWRGLCAGVLEATVAAMAVPGHSLLAWIGPCIQHAAFEVGEEVRAAFLHVHADDADCFSPSSRPAHWLADLARLATRRLRRCGLDTVLDSGLCTASDAALFFSYRRDGQCGRQASLIWRDPESSR